MINKIVTTITYSWDSVFEEEGKPYRFPRKMTQYMKSRYNHPAIYQWRICNKAGRNKYYIGEAKQLCPQRINGYLSPGPLQKTNIRLNTFFHSCLENYIEIYLELLMIDSLLINEFQITQKDLEKAHLRKYVESLVIAHYMNKELEVLNLGCMS